MNIFSYIVGALVGARKAPKVEGEPERTLTGVLFSLSGDGSIPVYDNDVTGAFAKLYDVRYPERMYGITTRTQSSRAQYYRIVPDRVVERVCEVREVAGG